MQTSLFRFVIQRTFEFVNFLCVESLQYYFKKCGRDAETFCEVINYTHPPIAKNVPCIDIFPKLFTARDDVQILNDITLSYPKGKPPIREPLCNRIDYNTFYKIIYNNYFRRMNSFFPDAIISCKNIIKHFHNL